MMLKQSLNTKDEIEDIGLTKLKEYLLIDPAQIKDAQVLIHFLHKAKLGMQFTREMNLSRRAVESNTIRIFKLTAESKAELKRLFKQSLPQYNTQ